MPRGGYYMQNTIEKLFYRSTIIDFFEGIEDFIEDIDDIKDIDDSDFVDENIDINNINDNEFSDDDWEDRGDDYI